MDIETKRFFSENDLFRIPFDHDVRFFVPELDFGFSDLEPRIDAKTMELHITKHHAAYVEKANAVMHDFCEHYRIEMSVEEIVYQLSKKSHREPRIYWDMRNSLGGHMNHTLFWKCLTPHHTAPSDFTLNKMRENFGGLLEFQDEFRKSALSLFGSGWTWLVTDSSRSSLHVVNTSNQDNPAFFGKIPIFGLDLWEHAYYLQYFYDRAKYTDNFWELLDWNFVHECLTIVLGEEV